MEKTVLVLCHKRKSCSLLMEALDSESCDFERLRGQGFIGSRVQCMFEESIQGELTIASLIRTRK